MIDYMRNVKFGEFDSYRIEKKVLTDQGELRVVFIIQVINADISNSCHGDHCLDLYVQFKYQDTLRYVGRTPISINKLGLISLISLDVYLKNKIMEVIHSNTPKVIEMMLNNMTLEELKHIKQYNNDEDECVSVLSNYEDDPFNTENMFIDAKDKTKTDIETDNETESHSSLLGSDAAEDSSNSEDKSGNDEFEDIDHGYVTDNLFSP